MTNSRPTPRLSRRTIITGAAGALGLAAAGGTAWALDRYLIEHTNINILWSVSLCKLFWNRYMACSF